jgi:hypothetical protein
MVVILISIHMPPQQQQLLLHKLFDRAACRTLTFLHNH